MSYSISCVNVAYKYVISTCPLHQEGASAPGDSNQWSLQHAIDFVKQFTSKEDLLNQKPQVDSSTWEEICVVFDICLIHGSDPHVVYEKMVQHFDAIDSNEVIPSQHDEDTAVGTIDRKDALATLQAKFHDEDLCKKLLDDANGDLDRAFWLGTQQQSPNNPTPVGGDLVNPKATPAVVIDDDEDDVNSPMAPLALDDGQARQKMIEHLERHEDTHWDESMLQYRLGQTSMDTMQTLAYNPDGQEADIPEIPPSQLPLEYLESVTESVEVAPPAGEAQCFILSTLFFFSGYTSVIPLNLNRPLKQLHHHASNIFTSDRMLARLVIGPRSHQSQSPDSINGGSPKIPKFRRNFGNFPGSHLPLPPKRACLC